MLPGLVVIFHSLPGGRLKGGANIFKEIVVLFQSTASPEGG